LARLNNHIQESQMNELYSKSQLKIILPLREAARKQKAKRQSQSKDAAIRRTIASQTSPNPEPLSPKTTKSVYRELLSRAPSEDERRTIKNLWSDKWSISAIACGLELRTQTVADTLSSD
jgi:hypothetical protein